MENLGTNESITVWIGLPRAQKGMLTDRLELAAANGTIETVMDYEHMKAALLEEKRNAIASIQDAPVEYIEALGVRSIRRCRSMSCLVAELTSDQITALAGREDIVTVQSLSGIGKLEEVSGEEILQGTQLKQLVDTSDGTHPPYDGEYGSGSSDDLLFATAELGTPHIDHKAFNDASSPYSERINTLFQCNDYTCWVVDYYSPPADGDSFIDNHFTATAGITFGDLRDSQDSAITSTEQRIERSGYAGESWIQFYKTNGSEDSWAEALGKMPDPIDVPRLVNSSWGFNDTDTYCRGTDSLSRVSNELFENGILQIKSAGNEFHYQNPANCNITSPGSAIGTFTVGGHTNSPWQDDEDDVRHGIVYYKSSRGGVSWSDGRHRSIVDVTATACRTKALDAYGGYTTQDCGTSFAAPTVTGAALDFVDWYKSNVGDSIDQPGRLFASLLLFGDRQQESGGKMTTRFDHLWGAGRLKMRMFNTYGMDRPYKWVLGRGCISHHSTVTYTFPNPPVESDADIFKAVLFWYDRRHENGSTIDNLDLKLYDGTTLLRQSNDSYDNKERIYYSGIGGKSISLKIYGANVTADNEGCGTNRMRFYFAAFYEDSARDDAEGPWNYSWYDWSVEPE